VSEMARKTHKMIERERERERKRDRQIDTKRERGGDE
jgi:hypothetical protein